MCFYLVFFALTQHQNACPIIVSFARMATLANKPILFWFCYQKTYAYNSKKIFKCQAQKIEKIFFSIF